MGEQRHISKMGYLKYGKHEIACFFFFGLCCDKNDMFLSEKLSARCITVASG